MPAKKATKSANAVATLYEGAFDITFDCVGVEVCRFGLCSEMPPTGREECTFREHGSWRRTAAQIAAVESLRVRLAKELKRLEEDCEG